ncbi:MAG: hypothetical protein RIN55_10505 [Tissierellaceae bacterium]|nr:hypothetical protein [Tissierellaceae bacterium]
MIDVDQGTVLSINGDPNSMMECVKCYFKDKWVKDIYENLRNGYYEMSQINLTLAEIGLEDDMTDLCKYEIRLTGRDTT